MTQVDELQPVYGPPEPTEPEFDIYTATREEVNVKGLCGHMLPGYRGKKCEKKIITWFGDEEDQRVGACGTHAKETGETLKQHTGSIQRRQIERFLKEEVRKAVNILNNAGLKVRVYDGYSQQPSIIIKNWGLLLAWLDGKGLDFDDRDWEKVAQAKLDAEAAKICKNCLLEHPMDEKEYGPGCDEFNLHGFFKRKNNKDLCEVCGGPESALLHDEEMLERKRAQ